MDQRKLDLILRIVDQYIESGHPVGSAFLVEKYHLDFSSATIRNEMAVLEEEGYMSQPHSSAGRVPTEMGYQLYVQYVRPSRSSPRQEAALQEVVEQNDPEVVLKNVVRHLAEYSGEIAFGSMNGRVVSAGMSNLCTKPEFADRALVAAISQILDNLEEVVTDISPHTSEEPEVWIGQNNHLTNLCSCIIMRVPLGRDDGIFGIIGPMRMHYDKNLSLMHSLKKHLS